MIEAQAKSEGHHGRRRGLTRFLPAALVVGALLWSAQAFSQKTNNRVRDPIAEKKYWEALHQREAKQRAAEVDWENQQRDEVKMKVVEIIRSQEAIQTQMIVAEDGPSQFKPETPSLLQRYPEQVGLGLAAALVLALATQMGIRIKQQAEIRKLCGGYLSDGTEVSSYKLPEWFAPAPAPMPVAEFAVEKNESVLEVGPPAAVVEFFEKASERLAGIRAALKELGASGSSEDRQKTLVRAHELVCELRDKASVWELRPAWQMSSVLELLVKRVVDKPKDMTSSVVRTIAAAVDVLHEVCVPGVRPNLLNDPPLKVLAVDDDPLCRRALQFALEKANLATDVAEDGEKAVELATAHNYDVVFMDIQMPGIDGLTACGQIHETKKNADVPVIFVTVQSDFNTRAQLRLKGGADLMAKPFLVFELTVRAVTFAMRRRLQAAMINRRETFAVAPISPILQTASASATEAAPAALPPKTTTTAPAIPEATPALAVNPAELAGDFYSESPAFLAETRKIVDGLQQPGGAAALEEHLGALYLRVHALASKASLAKLPIAAQVGFTLEALLKRLYRNPKTVTPSTLNTAANALRLLEVLCQPGTEEKLANHDPVRILVVDDEPLARRAVVGALQLAFKQPESAEDGTQAAALVAKSAYDVIFTDVQMPGLDGFELCKAIRESASNAGTPVVFITTHTDVEAQTKATACGGNDFIGKPFLPIEITVKALTFAWENRLRSIHSAHSAPSTLPAALENSPELVIAPTSPILQSPATSTPEAVTSIQSVTQTAVATTEENLVTPMGADELTGDFFSEVTPFLSATRAIIERLQSPNAPSSQAYLQAQLDVLYLRMRTLAARADLDQLQVAAHVASTLESLLKRLQRNPKTLTASTLNTVLYALRLLESVCLPGVEEKLTGHAPIRILVVDDEPLARRAIVGALQLAFKQPESASDGTKASRMVNESAYDVIFTDVQMPGLNGFELCSAIRASSLNDHTPVVFVTNNTDVEAQAKAVVCGGNDFIGKPFLPIEITVKALTFAWEGRLKKLQPAPEKTAEPLPSLIAA